MELSNESKKRIDSVLSDSQLISTVFTNPDVFRMLWEGLISTTDETERKNNPNLNNKQIAKAMANYLESKGFPSFGI